MLMPESRQRILTAELRKAGYEQGGNLAIDAQWDEKTNKLPTLASGLAAENPDIIAVVGTQAALAAERATTTIPIVFLASNPVENGLVRSLARPGANATGLSLQSPDLSGKRLELLLEAAGHPAKVGVLYKPDDPPAVDALHSTLDAVERWRLQAVTAEARTPADLAGALEQLARERAGALVILTSPLTTTHAKEIADIALRLKLPSVFADAAFAREGGLMSYGPDFEKVVQRMSFYIDRILKGEKTETFPVEQPTAFGLHLNMKTAKLLGLVVPSSLLALTDEVIE